MSEEIESSPTEPSTETPGTPEASTEAPQSGPPSLDDRIVTALKTVYDPEIPVDIYELGLIYDIAVDEKNHAYVKMTLTSPACPVAGSLPGEVEDKVRGVDGVESAEVDLVWDPAWNPNMMSEAAKLELGMF